MDHPSSTQRTYLKTITQEYINLIHKGLSDPRVTQHYAVHFPTLSDTQEQMDWYQALLDQGTGAWFAIHEINSDTFIGAGGFSDVYPTHRKGEVGFWLLPEYWGQGFMSEVMPSLLRYGHDHLRLHRIEGFVDSDNVKCKQALKKVGLTYEGTMRDCEFKDGRFLSVDIYAKIDSGS